MSKARRGCGCVGCLGCGGVVGLTIAAALTALGIPAGFRLAASAREVEVARTVAPGHFVEVGELGIHVMEWGPKEGPRIFLVPGSSAWALTWVELARPLAKKGYRVVGLDLPPFGYSDRPVDEAYSRAAQAERILGLLAAYEAKDAVLIGHSFGGGATLEAAMTAPEGQLSHLILIDPALALDAPDSAIAPVTDYPTLREPIVAMTFTNPEFLPYGVASMVADPASATEERVARYTAPLWVEGTTPAIGAWTKELLAPAPSRAGDRSSYASFELPTGLIWGAEDTVTPVAQGEQLEALLPKGELVVLPGLGHIPQIEDADAVANAVLELLK